MKSHSPSDTHLPKVSTAQRGLPLVGNEGQRRADRGDGSYLNPVVAGDHADPTILKDGTDYYMTFSSFLSYPGIVIWHSTDLVNWAPIIAALREYIGAIWALDLIKYAGRYYIYIPAVRPEGVSLYVIHARDIRGPWSKPIDLGVRGAIDPGHAVGEDGKRYLFVNGVRRIQLADDGLSTRGELEHVLDPWRYPEDWVVEMFAPEGPKIFQHGTWFYLVAAVGGTAGPPTSHMVTVARSRSIHGPWQHCPHNPVVHTENPNEPWWSRGHASIVEGPAGDYWMLYHGYENGFRTLGRQTLLEPIEWTSDGWPRATGGTLATPLPKPLADKAGPTHELSDDFTRDRLGTTWAFFDPDPRYLERVHYAEEGLVLAGKGSSPADCSPLLCIAGDRSYEASVELEISGQAQGGLVLFYEPRGYAGLGFDGEQMYTYNYGQEHSWMRQAVHSRTLRIKLVNRSHVVTFYYATDGHRFVKHPWQMEVSGLHHNVFGGFHSLKPGVFAAGTGQIKLKNFSYRGLAAG